MAKYSIEESTLTEIANAIRTQTGLSEDISVNDMPNMINSISGGNFINSDWNQNNPEAINYVKNRTHWMERLYEPIIWDGIIEGKEVIDAGPLVGSDEPFLFYKVSDEIFDETLLNGSTVSAVAPNDMTYTGTVYKDQEMSSAFDFATTYDVSVMWYPPGDYGSEDLFYGYLTTIAQNTYGIPEGLYIWIGENCIGLAAEFKHDIYHKLSMEYLPDGYPYEKTLFDITWDGVIGDKFDLDLTPLGFEGVHYIKISDEVFNKEQIIGAIYTQRNGYACVLGEGDIDIVTYPGAMNIDNGIIICYSADETSTALGLPSGYLTNGIYFIYDTTGDELNFTNRFLQIKVIKIDEKYLPESVITKENINNYIPSIPNNLATQSYVQNYVSNSIKNLVTQSYVQNYVSNSINTAITDAIGGIY